MYKLTVVAGPNRGSSFVLHDGDNSIGRQSGNAVMLDSARVSRRHCTLVVDNGEVLLRDDGSASGTFVNGVLTKNKRLEAGDKISVGEFVFELVRASGKKRPSKAPAAQVPGGNSNILRFPVAGEGPGSRHFPIPSAPAGLPARRRSSSAAAPAFQQPVMPSAAQGWGPSAVAGADPFGAPAAGLPGAGVPDLSAGAATGPAAAPTNLKERVVHWFENQLMPVFYDLAFKQEWKSIAVTLFGIFVLGSVMLTVQPMLEQQRTVVVKEVGRRAQFMSRQIVDRNIQPLLARTETKTEIGSIEREEGVRVAVLTDLDSRILAPSSKYNQYLALGHEARLAAKARELFRKGKESGLLVETNDGAIVSIEPVKIFNPQLGRNIVVAMAIVSLDTTLSVPAMGESGATYGTALVYITLLGGLILVILYRLTLKPFEVLNDDIDKVLKGEMGQVTHEFKMAELDSLWEVINAALQRVPRADAGGGMGSMGGGGANPEDFAGPLRLLASTGGKAAVAFCDADRRVLHLNEAFEEVAGIRADNAVGQELVGQARDQAFAVLLSDLFSRAQPGSDAGPEDFEFSGVAFRCTVSAIGAPGSGPRGYIFVAERKED